MFTIDPDRPTGPWQTRVRFGPDGTFAYRPGEVLVKAEAADFANEALRQWAEDSDGAFDVYREEGLIAESFARFKGSFEVGEAIDRLHSRGILAQVNHVLFATVCCPPHPSDPSAEAFYAGQLDANPFYAHSLSANPFYAHSYANPFYAHSPYANPFYAHSGCGCSCDCGCGRGSNPFSANPFYAHADRSPFADRSSQHTGARRSSARPADAPEAPRRQPVEGVRVVVFDTGWAEASTPTGLPGIDVVPFGGDRPDEDGDGFVDPAAGHGTFIAGIIEQLTPGCRIEVVEVLSTYGDGDEAEIARALHTLAQRPEEDRPHVVNLSFGGYSSLGMAAMAVAVKAVHDAGIAVVASAGNDATCVPLFPAALPHVVGVAALERDGKAARFTNYGPWVRASTLGVDVTSLFFEGFDGAGPPESNYDPDRFEGWARWSGTSFAAPAVVAALARMVGQGVTAHDAVAQLIDDKNLPRRPMLGTIVDPGK